MKLLRILAAAAAATFLMAGTGFADPINKKCPMSGEDVDAEKGIEVTVTFCCENCKGKFDKDPIKYLAKVADAEDGKCPMSGKDAKKEQSSTVKVATCCGKCEKKAKEDVKETLKKVKE